MFEKKKNISKYSKIMEKKIICIYNFLIYNFTEQVKTEKFIYIKGKNTEKLQKSPFTDNNKKSLNIIIS